MSTSPRRAPRPAAGLVLLPWLCLLAVVPSSGAPVAVCDASTCGQATIPAVNAVRQVAQQAAQYARQAQQLEIGMRLAAFFGKPKTSHPSPHTEQKGTP